MPAADHSCVYGIDMLAAPGPLELYRMIDGARQATAVTVGPYPYDVQHITLKDDSKVNLTQADLDRVGRENRQIRALWQLHDGVVPMLPLAAPLKPLPAGGRFGSRRIINGQPRNPHSGADYSAVAGTPVLAVAGGTVALTGDHFFAGNSVFLDHGGGLITMYFHLQQILVKDGDIIPAGHTIGLVGSSGRATGPHLHFGARLNGARVDPAVLLGTGNEPITLP